MNPNTPVTKIEWNSFHCFVRCSRGFWDAQTHRLTHRRTHGLIRPKTECLRTAITVAEATVHCTPYVVWSVHVLQLSTMNNV